MKKLIFITGMFFLPLLIHAQFEQKLSFNVSAGIFKTFGTKTYIPDWSADPDDSEPYQMPNYRPGISIKGSIQFNINRHFSLKAEVGYMHSGSWSYFSNDINYLHYTFYDTITDELLAEGENELDFTNLGIGITPVYYFLPEKKINPYLFFGVNINFTKAAFRSNEWQAEKDLGMLDPGDTTPWNDFMEENTGLGLNPGIGLLYNMNERLGFTFTAGYYLIFLDESNFKSSDQVENFHSFTIQAGIRFSFLKSKEL